MQKERFPLSGKNKTYPHFFNRRFFVGGFECEKKVEKIKGVLIEITNTEIIKKQLTYLRLLNLRGY